MLKSSYQIIFKFFILIGVSCIHNGLQSQNPYTERASDIIQIALPGVAGISTIIWNDNQFEDTNWRQIFIFF